MLTKSTKTQTQSKQTTKPQELHVPHTQKANSLKNPTRDQLNHSKPTRRTNTNKRQHNGHEEDEQRNEEHEQHNEEDEPIPKHTKTTRVQDRLHLQ